MGLQNTLSQGLISGKRDMDGYRVFQISAPISHGSSGGPIFNSAAEVVGIAAFMIETGQSLNFAIPIDYARGMLSASNPQPLSSIYEPEPAPAPEAPPPTPAAPAAQAAPGSVGTIQTPDEMKQQSAIFLEKKLQTLTDTDAQQLHGAPVRHRYFYDQNKTISGDIYAYPDPTRLYREFELTFDVKTKRMTGVFVYPWDMSWAQCKKLWGDDAAVTKNPDGTKADIYRKRRLNVPLDKDSKVINFGLY